MLNVVEIFHCVAFYYLIFLPVMYTQGTFRVYQQRSMDVEQKKQCYQVRK